MKDQIFRRGQKLVRIVQEEFAPLRIETLPRRQRRMLLTPSGELPELPELRAVVNCPVMTPDGRFLTKRGYDAHTGIYQACARPAGAESLPAISEHPNTEEVQLAKDWLLELVCDFPFAEPKDRSAWLAGLLTPFVRHAYDGPTPLFLVDKNGPMTGGTLLCDITAVIATGVLAPRLCPDMTEEEAPKLITSVAQHGYQMVVLDTICKPFGTAALNSMLTATGWQSRTLGTSEVEHWPLLTVWWACGNNVQLNPDTSRRVLPIRLHLQTPNPEARPDESFQHADLFSYVVAHRAVYLHAVMTLLRAFMQSEAAQKIEVSPWGSYSAWSNIVRKLILWLGLPDPLQRRQKYYLLKTNLPQHSDYLALWWRPMASGYTTNLDQAGIYEEEAAFGYAGADAVAVRYEDARSAAFPVVSIADAEGWFPPRPKVKHQPRRCASCTRFVRRDGWLCSACQDKEMNTGKATVIHYDESAAREVW